MRAGKVKMNKFSAITGVIAMSFALPTSAATVMGHIDLTGHQYLQDSLSFSDAGVDLTVTGHLQNSDGSIGSQEKVGQYGNGLGVTNDNEYVWKTKTKYKWVKTRYGWKKKSYKVSYKHYTDQHFLDSNGENEVLKFAFSRDVTLNEITFSYGDSHDDFSFSVFADGSVQAFDKHVDIPDSFTSTYVFDTLATSSMFGIGAYGYGDAFKVKSIKFSYDDGSDNTPPVPLPAGGALLLTGLGVLALRRRLSK